MHHSNPNSRSAQPAGITQILTFDKKPSLYSRLYSNLQNNTRLTSINNRLKHLILKICSTGGFDTLCSWSPMIVLSVSHPGQDLQNWRGVVAVLRTKKVVTTMTLLATFIIALLQKKNGPRNTQVKTDVNSCSVLLFLCWCLIQWKLTDNSLLLLLAC